VDLAHPDYCKRATSALATLDLAVADAHCMVNAMSPNNPHMPFLLNNPGDTLKTRWYIGETTALVAAITYTQRAITLTPSDHPHMPISLDNLGVLLRRRYGHFGEVTD
jgi:hypothetical protein